MLGTVVLVASLSVCVLACEPCTLLDCTSSITYTLAGECLVDIRM